MPSISSSFKHLSNNNASVLLFIFNSLFMSFKSMLDFLFKKETTSAELLNDFYSKLREMYSFESISDERKEYLKSTMDKFGYLPYPQIKALEELTDAEVLWALESKWEKEGVFKDGKLEFSKASVLARNNVKDSSWLQKEGHDI